MNCLFRPFLSPLHFYIALRRCTYLQHSQPGGNSGECCEAATGGSTQQDRVRRRDHPRQQHESCADMGWSVGGRKTLHHVLLRQGSCAW